MSLRKARYIHVPVVYGKNHGFSVLFFPLPQMEDHVSFSVARCHKDDSFNKKRARELLETAEIHTCRVVDFPAVLAKLKNQGSEFPVNMNNKTEARFAANRFAWVWKYFL